MIKSILKKISVLSLVFLLALNSLTQNALGQGALFTNNFVELTAAKGELIHFNNEGIVLKSEDGKIQPRLEWLALTDFDCKGLLLTPKLFSAVTSFRAPTSNPIDSVTGTETG